MPRILSCSPPSRYNVAFLVLTYAIPVGAMAITYPWMGMVLWRSQTIGEINDRQKFAVKNKKRVSRLCRDFLVEGFRFA